MRHATKRWSSADFSEQHESSPLSRPGSRRGRHRTFLLVLAAVVLATFVLVLYIVTETASRSPRDDLLSAAWLQPAEDSHAWQAALHAQSLLNTPAAHGLALQQVFFISCNRHDRSQAYWAMLAVAAQCELLSRGARASAAPCRRLYAGQTPLSPAGGVLTEETRWVRTPAPLTSLNEVPLGACGTVYDSTAAAQHRASLSVNDTAAAASRASHHFPVSPLKADPVPLDAVLWLGDAIYADKRADGVDGQTLLTHHSNSLAEVGRFWAIQRDAPAYTAFVASCVAASNLSTPATEALRKPAVDTLGDVEREVEVHPDRAAGVAATRHKGAPVQVLGDLAAAEDDLDVPQPPTVASTPRNVWGTWDDHDMGKNDGGKEYPHRNVTQRFFLDFLRAPATDPRWTREGVYEAYTLPFHAVVDNTKGWGPSLETLLRQLYVHAVCVVLLDVRSFRDPPNATYAGDMLGAAQWAWLEEQLQRFTRRGADAREPCAVTLVGSGIQFMLDEKPAENWAAFPGSRDRLLGLLRVYRAERVAFLTGDVHMGELGGDFTAQTIRGVLGYPLIEATSSGLTHSANMFHLPTLLPLLFPSPRRLALYVEKNFGAVRLSVDLLHLPALRRYLSNVTASPGQSVVLHTAAERQLARDVVQRALNVTFTIFSIPQYGQPVHRLNFPLSMLTYLHGPSYLGAKVNAVNGDVHAQSPAEVVLQFTSPLADTRTFSTFALKNGTMVTVPHYPNTSPVPFVTWYTRLAQRHIFTHSSVSETLKWCLIAQICVGLVLSVCVLVWVWRRVHLRCWTLLTQRLQKDKKR
uniref:Alkaline phosphatase n=1 Tax=Crithidia acanthocephali TaxID=59798 RepID=T1YUN1_9TRYP|nr:alkaline phosphatase [Crithidia acanthocephali]